MIDLTQAVDAEYVVRMGPKRENALHVVRASQLGSQPRRLAFELDPESKRDRLTARTARVFEVGNERHDALRRVIAAVLPTSRVPVTKDAEEELERPLGVGDWRVVGHPDGIITDPITVNGHRLNGPTLLEIKTVNAFGWTDALAGKLDDKYLVQGAWYALAGGCMSRVYVLEKKDTQHLAYLVLPAADPLLERALAWAREAVQLIGRPLEAPECSGDDYGWGWTKTSGQRLNWKCSYCPFVSACFPQHVRVVQKGRPVCIPREAVAADAVVVGMGRDVVPAGTWKMLNEEVDDG